MQADGILLINLGSPDSPQPEAVKKYLHEFLMDERVLDLPYPIRRLVVSGFILPFRPKRSAAAYQSIWWPEGSPLIVLSTRLQAALQEKIELPIELGMRYGSPSIQDGLAALNAGGVTRIFVIPLYPHYAMSTYETVVVAAKVAAARVNPNLKLYFKAPFYEDPDYLRALAAVAQPYLQKSYDHLLFSYHGIPERHLKKTDSTSNHCLKTPVCCQQPSPAHETCYRHQVLRTSAAVLMSTAIPQDKSSLAFQSRLGADAWLQPYTEAELVRLGRLGTKRLLVMCPAFVSDCLETLEEIGERGRETFHAAGGGEFELIPCLNDHPTWVEVLADWCRQIDPQPNPSIWYNHP